MNPQIRQLLIVQDRDRTLRELRQDLERIPAEIERASRKSESHKTGARAAHDAAHAIELGIRQIELEVKTRRDSIAKLNIQRFETRKNEEYTAMGGDISRHEEEIRRLEDRELELMEELEAARKRVAEADAEQSAVEAAVNSEIAALNQRAENERGRLAGIEAEREKDRSSADPALLALYDRLLPRKFPPVVPVMAGEMCGGCHMKLTVTVTNDVRSGILPTQCASCGRILYMD